MSTREHYLAFAQGSNNRDLSALPKAINTSFQSSFEVPVPEGADDVTCSFVLSSVSGASVVLMKVEGTPDGSMWVPVKSLTNEVINGDEVEYDLLTAVYKTINAANGLGGAPSYRISTMEKVRVFFKTDAGTAEIKAIFSFKRRSRYVY